MYESCVKYICLRRLSIHNMTERAVNLGVQPLLENAFADCFLAGVCAVPARNTVRIHNVLEIQQTIAIRNF